MLRDPGTWFRCLVKMVLKVEEDPHEDEVEYLTEEKEIKKRARAKAQDFIDRINIDNAITQIKRGMQFRIMQELRGLPPKSFHSSISLVVGIVRPVR